MSVRQSQPLIMAPHILSHQHNEARQCNCFQGLGHLRLKSVVIVPLQLVERLPIIQLEFEKQFLAVRPLVGYRMKIRFKSLKLMIEFV